MKYSEIHQMCLTNVHNRFTQERLTFNKVSFVISLSVRFHYFTKCRSIYVLIYYSDTVNNQAQWAYTSLQKQKYNFTNKKMFINKIHTHDKMQLCFNITCVR